MSHCNQGPVTVPQYVPQMPIGGAYNGACCAAEEIRDGIEHASKGLHELEHGLQMLECGHGCAGAEEYQKGLSDVELGIYEIADGIEKGGYVGCGGEVACGLKELQSAVRHGYDGLAKLTHGDACHGIPLVRESVGETRLGLQHILGPLRGLAGAFQPFFGLGL